MVILPVPPGSPTGIPDSSPEKLAVAIIPARYHSARLPGKPLADIDGRPMIQHVYRRVEAARTVRAVVVATDDDRIRTAVERFGGRAVMTLAAHRSGTERAAEVAAYLDAPVIVNVQADEPLIDPAMIDEVVAPFAADRHVEMTTLRRRIDDPDDLVSPHIVKVVTDRTGNALYFSRATIPWGHSALSVDSPPHVFKHIGLYGYRREFLLTLARLLPSPLEAAESLEQLRALEHGYRIKVLDTTFDCVGVDTPEDLERVRRLMSAGVRA